MNYFVIIIGFTKIIKLELKTLQVENWNHISVTLQERNGFDVVRSDFSSNGRIDCESKKKKEKLF
jgi:hypothetical protein